MNESSLNALYNLMGTSGSSSFAIAHLNGGRIGNSTSDTLILHRSHIPAPVKDGHSFVSWCTDSNCSERCDGNSSGPCNSRDIYAGWNTTTVITFLTNDDNNSTITKHLEFGQPIEFPGDLVKEGYSFIGWDNTTSTVPARDITISALWAINNYTLTFDFDNGTVAEVRTIKFNDPINYPEDPKKEGYRFIGWGNNITSMPARDITIKALWTANNYTITFMTNDDNNNSITKHLEFGQPIEFPEDLTKEGHSFIGWDNTTSTVPARDITISALWVINSYTLTFDFDNGTEAEMRTVKFNDPIEYPEDPKKEGHRFIGWDNNITNMPVRDITIKALWEEAVVGNVEIVFATKDITEKEIEEVIKKFTDSEFTIVEVSSNNGETIVIVKFVDENANAHFIRAVNEEKDDSIKHVGIVPDSGGISFSVSINPLLALLLNI